MKNPGKVFMMEVLFVLIVIGIISLYFVRRTITLDSVPTNMKVYFNDKYLGNTPIFLEGGMLKGDEYANAFKMLCNGRYEIGYDGIVIGDDIIRYGLIEDSAYSSFYMYKGRAYFHPKAYIQVFEKGKKLEKITLFFKDDPIRNLGKKYSKDDIVVIDKKKVDGKK